jgi:hypothetical protein
VPVLATALEFTDAVGATAVVLDPALAFGATLDVVTLVAKTLPWDTATLALTPAEWASTTAADALEAVLTCVETDTGNVLTVLESSRDARMLPGLGISVRPSVGEHAANPDPKPTQARHTERPLQKPPAALSFGGNRRT